MIIVSIVVIIMMGMRAIMTSYAPYGWDENGYVAQALLAYGINVSNVARQLPYYSFGNGFFVLLFFYITDNAIILYRCMLAFNVLLLVASYFFSFYFCRRVLRDEIKQYSAFIAFIVTLRPDMFIYINYFLSEIYLMFFFWLILFLIFKLYYEKRIIWEILLGISCVYSFFIHHRFIVVSALGIVLLFTFLLKEKSWGAFVLNTIVIIALFLVLSRYKAFTQSVLLANPFFDEGINDFQSIDTYGSGLSELVFWIRLFKVIVGKIWYMTIESFGMIVLGMVFMVRRLWEMIKLRNWDHESACLTFLFGTFWGTLGVTNYYLQYPGRIDHIIMSRYMEPIIGPMLLMGIAYFLSVQFDSNRLIFGSYIFVVSTKIVEQFADESLQRISWNVTESNPMIAPWLKNPYVKGDYIIVTGVFCLLMIVFWLLGKNNRFIFLIMVLMCFFIRDCDLQSQYSVANIKNYGEVTKIEDVIDKNSSVTFVRGDLMANEFQFLDLSMCVNIVEELDDIPIEGGEYLVIKPTEVSQKNELFLNNYSLICQVDSHNVYQRIIE